MRVFVTGATGLVGSLALRRLHAGGHEVIALSRRPPADTQDVTWVAGDAARPGPWLERAASADAVVHLAGEPIAARRWSAEQKARIRASRVESTGLVAEAVRRGGPGRALVCASACGYYGPRGDEELDETSPPGGDFLARVCVEWEAAARAAADAGVRVVSLRFGVVLSRRGGALPRMLPAFRMMVGGPLGRADNWFPWLHEDDAVGLVVHAVTREVRGPLNAVAPEPARMRDLADAIGRGTGRPALFRVPDFALRLALGELGAAINPGQKVAPRATLASGYQFVHPSLEGAVRALLA